MPGGRLIRAAGVVLAIRLALWCLPYRSVLAFLNRRRAALGLRQQRSAGVRRIASRPADIAWRVDVAGRMVPRATCLVKALAGQQLMAAEGHESTVRFGVAVPGGDWLEAHAWLEHDGRIVIGDFASGYVGFEPAAPRGNADR